MISPAQALKTRAQISITHAGSSNSKRVVFFATACVLHTRIFIGLSGTYTPCSEAKRQNLTRGARMLVFKKRALPFMFYMLESLRACTFVSV